LKEKTMRKEKISDALFDMYDIRNALSKTIKNRPKDNDGSIFTVNDCIENVIEFLEELRKGQSHA
jgi:hypothetical protein